jgi:hypothetical protein
LVAHPLPFRCNIVPRSTQHEELIRQAEAEHPWEAGDGMLLRGISEAQ